MLAIGLALGWLINSTEPKQAIQTLYRKTLKPKTEVGGVKALSPEEWAKRHNPKAQAEEEAWDQTALPGI